jgi:hypothetical protein
LGHWPDVIHGEKRGRAPIWHGNGGKKDRNAAIQLNQKGNRKSKPDINWRTAHSVAFRRASGGEIERSCREFYDRDPALCVRRWR